jgi:hypothetical protein
MKNITSENDIHTFRRIRKAIGWLGIALPGTLVILSFIPYFQTEIKGSISDYYYTNFREIFTGILCAVSLFLIRYRGTRNKKFWKNDSLMTNIAGILALGVVLLPTNPDNCSEKIYTFIPSCASWIGWLHIIFALGFFGILANISINVFTIGQADNKEIPFSLLNENNIYRACGWGMVIFLILLVVFDLIHLFRYSTLLLEGLMLWAFGISWLVKGRVIGDKGRIGMILYREYNQ